MNTMVRECWDETRTRRCVNAGNKTRTRQYVNAGIKQELIGAGMPESDQNTLVPQGWKRTYWFVHAEIKQEHIGASGLIQPHIGA